jgi:hypothetical protein
MLDHFRRQHVTEGLTSEAEARSEGKREGLQGSPQHKYHRVYIKHTPRNHFEWAILFNFLCARAFHVCVCLVDVTITASEQAEQASHKRLIDNQAATSLFSKAPKTPAAAREVDVEAGKGSRWYSPL